MDAADTARPHHAGPLAMISKAEAQRLHSTAEHVRTLAAEIVAERQRRNALMRELIDRGEQYRHVAAAAGVSSTTVADVMAFDDA